MKVASKPAPPAAAGKAAAPPAASATKEKKAKKAKEPAAVEKPAVDAAKKPGMSQMSLGAFFSKAPAGAPAAPKLAKPAQPVADKVAEKVVEKANESVAPVAAEKEVVLKTPVKEKSEDASPSPAVETPESTAAKSAASGDDEARRSSRESDLVMLGSEEPAACSTGTPPTAVKAAAAAAAEERVKPAGGEKPPVDSDDDCMVVDDAPSAPAAASKKPVKKPTGAVGGAKPSTAKAPAPKDKAPATTTPKDKTPKAPKEPAAPKEKKEPKEKKAKVEPAGGAKQMTLGFTKGEGGAKRQGTLDFGKAARGSSGEKKARAERPAHPTGTPIEASAEMLQVLQFVKTFKEPLRLPALSLENLEAWRSDAAKQPLTALHKALIRTVVKNGDTPGEERFIDDDTWPEVLRQHLADAHGPRCALASKALAADEYVALGREERLQALLTLLDDCLQTKAARGAVDGSVEAVEELRREQQLDEMQERYKKPEESAGERMDAFVDVTITLDDDSEAPAMTERQREVHKHKEEEAKAQRIADAIRLREESRVAQEAAKKHKETQRKNKVAARAASLSAAAATVRVPYLASGDRNYFLMNFVSNERRVVCERFEEDTTAPSQWSVLSTSGEHDAILQHWSPAFQENESGMQKRMRAFLPPPILPAADPMEVADGDTCDLSSEEASEGAADKDVAATEDVTMEEGAEGKPSQKGGDEKDEKDEMEDEMEEEAREEEAEVAEVVDAIGDARRALLGRAIQVVSDLGTAVPEAMFTDYDRFSAEQHPAWLNAVLQADSVEGLKTAVRELKEALNQGKMREGWDVVENVWVKDLSEARTLAAVLYFVRQLNVFIGKMKAKPGKIAAIFAPGTVRMTRARAGGEKAAGEKRKRYNYSSEEVEEDEDEDSSVQGSGSDGDYEEEEDDGQDAKRIARVAAREAASARRAQQEKKSARKKPAAAPTRRSTRATRGAPLCEAGSEEESSGDGSSPASPAGRAGRRRAGGPASKASEGEKRSTRSSRRVVSSGGSSGEE